MNVTNFLKTPVGLWVRKATKSLNVSRRKWIVGAAAIVMSTSVMATEVYTGTKSNIPMVGNAAAAETFSLTSAPGRSRPRLPQGTTRVLPIL